MEASMIVKNILVSLLLFIWFQNYGLSDDQVKRIWPHLFLTKGSDYQEMSDLMSERKSGYIKGMMDILVKSISGKVLDAVLTFHDLHNSDLQEAHKLLAGSLSVDFSSHLMQLFKKHNIPLTRRKFIFTHGKLLDFVSNNGVKNIPTSYLKMDVDYVLIGEYIVVNKKDLRLAINLIELKTGVTVGGFNVDASPANLAAKLAQNIFDYFQKNQSPPFENPASGLTWILEPVAEAFRKKVTRNQAQSYCASQKYRLPFAEEIMQLSGGGNYSPGGFELIHENSSCYFVADNRDMDAAPYAKGAYHYFTGLDEHLLNNGEIQIDSELPEKQKCYFVCVKGEVASNIESINKLYEIHRSKWINGIRVDDNIRSLVKYLLFKLDPYMMLYNSNVDQRWSKRYPTPEDGINALKKAGYL